MSEWLSPDVIASAPGRVNLIGEHIDYNQGFVLPFAISYRTTAQLRRRDDQIIRVRSKQRLDEVITTSISDLAPGSQGGWERYVLGVIWAFSAKEGVDIEIDGDVPLGAGLSSSAALECAVAIGLNELFSLGLGKRELALLTQKADLAASGLELLIIDTQVHHALVDGEYAKRRQACESASSKLHISSLREIEISELLARKQLLNDEEFMRAHHAVSEMARTLAAVEVLKRKDFVTLGALITQSHISLRDDYEVSCPELNCAVDVSLTLGALGARMVGGGFGGSAIALAEQGQIQELKSAIAAAFTSAGYVEPRFFTSLPSAGAKVVKKLDR